MSILGYFSDDEEDLEKLEEKKRKLERKAKVKRLKKEVSSGSSGIRSKVSRILEDFSKRGSGGSALSELVGPPEDARSTEDFILGDSRSGVENMSISEFITGQSDGHNQSKPFSFDEVAGMGGKKSAGKDWYEDGIV